MDERLSREAILDRLTEPFPELAPEVIRAAEALAPADPEIAEALAANRSAAALREDQVFSASRRSDAEFIAALRERLPHGAPDAGRVFGTRKLAALVTVSCVALLALVVGVGNRQIQPGTAQTPTMAAEEMATALDVMTPLVLDSLPSDAQVDAESLATYLEVPELAQNWDFEDDNSEEPLTDALLSLDPQQLEEVLNKLETVNFF